MNPSSFPRLHAACLHLAAANGAINRMTTQAAVEARMWREIERSLAVDEIQDLERWLRTLSHEQVETLVDGEQGEISDLEALAPVDRDGDSLALVFERVFEVL